MEVVARAGPGEYDEVIAFALTLMPLADRTLIAGSFDPGVATYIEVHTGREPGGGLLGTAVAFEFPELPPRMRAVKVMTRPEARGRGLASRLWGALVKNLGDTTSIAAQVYDDDPVALAVAQHWGFGVVERAITVRCDLASAAWPESSDGATFEVCDDLIFPDDRAAEAMLLASQTNPEVELGIVSTLAGLRTAAGAGQHVLAILARQDGAPAGISVAIADGDEMHVFYTGVDPAQRGHDLGRRTKQALHAHARELGVHTAVTDNEEHNTGIRHVNERLGCVKRYGTYWLKKDLPDGA